MVKKRNNTPSNAKGVFQKSNVNTLDPSSRGFVYDEVDDFHNDSDQDVIKFNDTHGSYSEEQVLGLGRLSSDESDDDDDDEIVGKVGSDEEEYFLPDDDIVDNKGEEKDDERAWGKKKRLFFGTDTTDERIHREALSRKNKEEDQEMEEEGAKRLQQRMAEQLEGLSFADLMPTVESSEKVEDDEGLEESVEVDVRRLSTKKKIRLLKQESPEFFPLLQDLKDKSEELKNVLQPLMDAMKKNLILPSPVMDYLKARYCLSLNYLTVICSYMMIKSSGTSVASHPVVERLAQYRHLFKELESCETLYEPQVEQLLDDLNSKKLKPQKKKKKSRKNKKLSILTDIKEVSVEPSNDFSMLDSDSEDEKQKPNALNDDSDEEDSIDGEMELDNAGEDSLGKDERRSIGRVILKNKGLMAKRNKDKSNPRVRYKNKYKNKLKRRKGQVQNVSKELYRYSGEVTGIKSSVVKSRKLQ